MTISDAAIHRLIELARWAPSGDNTQPWRFQRMAADHLVIHGFDTRDHCVYDLDGHSSQIAIGAMIETMHIAATEQSLVLDVSRRLDMPDTHPTFDVRLRHQAGVAPDPMLGAIPRRSVNRRPYSTKPLTDNQMRALRAALSPGYSLHFFSTLADRWRMARLMFANAKLRLTMREAYEVHRAIIDWGQRYSVDKVPDQALGVDAITLKLMRWAMADWQRVSFMNRWLGGTLAPRVQMDLAPSMLCAAHLAVTARTEPTSIDDYVNAGRAIQRLWLTATSQNLQHQPEMTPIIFSRYTKNGIEFTSNHFQHEYARRLSKRLDVTLREKPSNVVWLARIGYQTHPTGRSERLPIFSLQQVD